MDIGMGMDCCGVMELIGSLKLGFDINEWGEEWRKRIINLT